MTSSPANIGPAVAQVAFLLVVAEGFCAPVASPLGGWLGVRLGEQMKRSAEEEEARRPSKR
jgi:hypothetical protein